MMAARKSRQHGGAFLALLLLLLGILGACERQLQDSGIDLLPGNNTEEVDQSEAGIVDAPTSEAAQPVETEAVAEDQPVSGIPADDPAPMPGAEEAATEESPRPAAGEPEVTEEAPEETTGEAGEAATEEAVEATAEPEAEAPEDEAEADETATDEAAETGAADTTEEETADAEATEEDAAEETAAEETAAEETATDETATEEAAAEEAAEATQAPAAQERIHVVQAGENLYRIGLQYGISWLALANHNNLPNANAIYVGQQLRIPTEGAGTPTPTPPPATETTYVVQAGDTLSRIGQRFNLSWVTIAEANGLVNPNHIFVGQQLKIPGTGAAPNPQLTHTVQLRETLFLISLHYGVPWTRIASANNLSAPYLIYPGQTLVIPGSTQ